MPDQAVLNHIAGEARAGRKIEIDLPAQEIRNESGARIASFEVEEFRKHCLVNGFDDIGLTMQMEDEIKKYEERMAIETPWIGDSGYLKRRKRDGPVKVDALPISKTNKGEAINEPLEW